MKKKLLITIIGVIFLIFIKSYSQTLFKEKLKNYLRGPYIEIIELKNKFIEIHNIKNKIRYDKKIENTIHNTQYRKNIINYIMSLKIHT